MSTIAEKIEAQRMAHHDLGGDFTSIYSGLIGPDELAELLEMREFLVKTFVRIRSDMAGGLGNPETIPLPKSFKDLE